MNHPQDVQSPALSVVIVTYRSRDLIDRCLAPFAGRSSDTEIIVWDNASPDGTAEYISRSHPSVQLFESQENLGFAGGNNAAFARSHGRFVLLVNPDAFLENFGQVETMIRTLEENPDVAAVGPQLLNADGSHQTGDCGWRVGLASLLGSYLFLHRMIASAPAIYLTNRSLLKRPFVDVDWICGACMLVRKTVIDDVGGMDACIFMYGEDIEWGERMRARGYRLLYLPDLRVVHLQGATQRSDARPFYSTRHLDCIAASLSPRRPRVPILLVRMIIATGCAIAALAYLAKACIGRSGNDLARASNMWGYARYGATLRYD